MRVAVLAASALLLPPGTAAFAQARETVAITGSSTVFPFSSAVAEVVNRAANADRVRVTSTGTVRGFAEFCQGAGLQFPDVQNASRRITPGEFTVCAENGVNEIMEIPIGFDGIVVAYRKGLRPPNLTLERLWLGLAKEVPQNGRLVPNPYTSWQQVASSLPDWPIQVYGPPPTSGTRDSFAELALLAGCQKASEVRAISDDARRRQVCTTVREDGRWIDAGEDDREIVRRLAEAPPGTFGIFGFSFVEEGRDQIQPAWIEGVEPRSETILSRRYKLARPLYLYVKQPNLDLVPGLREFVAEYVSDRAMGPDGYLVRHGLVPNDMARLRVIQEAVRDRAVMRRP
jgi:phosphate transport system substrate-binding protein